MSVALDIFDPLDTPSMSSVVDLINTLSTVNFDVDFDLEGLARAHAPEAHGDCKGCSTPAFILEDGYHDAPCTCTYCPVCTARDSGDEYDPVYPFHRGTACTCGV